MIDSARSYSGLFDRRAFCMGFGLSFLVHTVLVCSIIFSLSSPYKGVDRSVVYSVTIEGGKTLGGVQQIETKKKTEKAPHKKVRSEPVKKPEPPKKTKVEKKPEKIVKKKSDAEVSLQEKKKKPEPVPEKKKQVVQKKTVTKKKPVAKKPPENVNTQYQKAMQRYLGESSNAGGKGFGAASLGGAGMGGGVVVPPEVIRYQKLLADTIKAGWKWHDTNSTLVAKAYFELSPGGVISKVRIEQGSGNREFDDSVIRAISKASPVPPAPSHVYKQYFQYVRMRFDPRE